MAIQGMWYNPKNFFIQIIPTLVLTQILSVIGPKNATWYSTSILIAIYPSYLSICGTSSVLWISWNGSHNIWFLIIFAIINLLFCRVLLNLWLTGVYLGLNYIRSFWLRCSQKRSSVSHHEFPSMCSIKDSGCLYTLYQWGWPGTIALSGLCWPPYC